MEENVNRKTKLLVCFKMTCILFTNVALIVYHVLKVPNYKTCGRRSIYLDQLAFAALS